SVSSEATLQAHEDHCSFFMDFLARRKDEMIIHMPSRIVAEITAELKNVRSAVNWALEYGHIERYYDAMMCVTLFYHFKCLFEEGEEVSGRIISKLRNGPPGPLLGRALTMQGWFTELLSQDFDRATVLLEEAGHLGEVLGDVDFYEDVYLRLS